MIILLNESDLNKHFKATPPSDRQISLNSFDNQKLKIEAVERARIVLYKDESGHTTVLKNSCNLLDEDIKNSALCLGW